MHEREREREEAEEKKYDGYETVSEKGTRDGKSERGCTKWCVKAWQRDKSGQQGRNGTVRY